MYTKPEKASKKVKAYCIICTAKLTLGEATGSVHNLGNYYCYKCAKNIKKS